MSIHARLWLVAGTSLLVGGAVGAYAARALYGEEPDVQHPNAEESSCPPCPDCPSCPPSEPCGHEPPPEDDRPRWAPESDAPEEAAHTGLLPTALTKAQELLTKVVDPCVKAASQGESTGLLVVSFTLTSSAGFASVSRAEVIERRGLEPDSEAERCVIDGARQVRFEWEDEGRQELVMPLRFGAE